MRFRRHWQDEVDEPKPGHVTLRPETSTRAVGLAVEHAAGVGIGFDPAPELLDALREASRTHPTTSLSFYGRYHDAIDPDLPFLDGFEHLRSLSLNLRRLRRFDGLGRLRALRTLSITSTGGKASLRPLSGLTDLVTLHLDGSTVEDGTLAQLTRLRDLAAPSAGGLVEGLRGHPTLQRLSLHFGTETDLGALPTVAGLRDLELWQLRGLQDADLEPLGEIGALRALGIGAARNLTSLEALSGLATTLRFLALEKVPGLETLEPIAALSRLTACTLFESRPADRSLKPLQQLPRLTDLIVGDSYPREERDALLAAQPTARILLRGGPQVPDADWPRMRWRGLFAAVDDWPAEDVS